MQIWHSTHSYIGVLHQKGAYHWSLKIIRVVVDPLSMQVEKYGESGNYTEIIYSINIYWVPAVWETQGSALGLQRWVRQDPCWRKSSWRREDINRWLQNLAYHQGRTVPCRKSEQASARWAPNIGENEGEPSGWGSWIACVNRTRTSSFARRRLEHPLRGRSDPWGQSVGGPARASLRTVPPRSSICAPWPVPSTGHPASLWRLACLFHIPAQSTWPVFPHHSAVICCPQHYKESIFRRFATTKINRNHGALFGGYFFF